MGRPSALRPVALANATELLRSRRYTSLRTLSLPDDLDDVDRWLIGTHHELRMDEQARALGVTYAIVSYWRVGLSRRGLLDARMRAGNAPITAAEADAIARLYRDGYSRLSIAALREISMGRVVAALEKAGALGAPRLVRLNAARVSALLGIGRADVLRWVARGWLPDYRVRNVPGARHAWDLDDLVALVRNRDSWVAWSPAQITSTELRAWLSASAGRPAGRGFSRARSPRCSVWTPRRYGDGSPMTGCLASTRYADGPALTTAG